MNVELRNLVTREGVSALLSDEAIQVIDRLSEAPAVTTPIPEVEQVISAEKPKPTEAAPATNVAEVDRLSKNADALKSLLNILQDDEPEEAAKVAKKIKAYELAIKMAKSKAPKMEDGGDVNAQVIYFGKNLPLSSGLITLTGCSFNANDFESLDGSPLGFDKLFRHKQTGKVFEAVSYSDEDNLADEIKMEDGGEVPANNTVKPEAEEIQKIAEEAMEKYDKTMDMLKKTEDIERLEKNLKALENLKDITGDDMDAEEQTKLNKKISAYKLAIKMAEKKLGDVSEEQKNEPADEASNETNEVVELPNNESAPVTEQEQAQTEGATEPVELPENSDVLPDEKDQKEDIAEPVLQYISSEQLKGYGVPFTPVNADKVVFAGKLTDENINAVAEMIDKLAPGEEVILDCAKITKDGQSGYMEFIKSTHLSVKDPLKNRKENSKYQIDFNVYRQNGQKFHNGMLDYFDLFVDWFIKSASAHWAYKTAATNDAPAQEQGLSGDGNTANSKKVINMLVGLDAMSALEDEDEDMRKMRIKKAYNQLSAAEKAFVNERLEGLRTKIKPEKLQSGGTLPPNSWALSLSSTEEVANSIKSQPHIQVGTIEQWDRLVLNAENGNQTNFATNEDLLDKDIIFAKLDGNTVGFFDKNLKAGLFVS